MKMLKGWTYLFTFGYTVLVFAKGNHRKGIDKNTGAVVAEYDV